MQTTECDPKGLVRESYRIDGITLAECQSIFIDWALSLPVDAPLSDLINALLAQYDAAEPGHPMGAVLREGLDHIPEPRRRGGHAARVQGGS